MWNEARSGRFICSQEQASDIAEETLQLWTVEADFEGAKLAFKSLGEYIRKMEVTKVLATSKPFHEVTKF